MKEEIKEILDKPKILMLSYGNYISLDDYVKLKDYITNLQEENRQTKLLKERYQLEKEVYKQRNEKAIKYITEDDLFYYGDELYDSYQEIVNILKGDKDE